MNIQWDSQETLSSDLVWLKVVRLLYSVDYIRLKKKKLFLSSSED